MARQADAAGLAPFLAVAGGLVLLGASAVAWFERSGSRAIGDVLVAQPETATGIEMAPSTVVVALSGLVCGLAMLVTRGTVRRVIALLAAVAGLVGVVVVGAVGIELDPSAGAFTAAPVVAAVGAAGVLVAGLAGMVRPGLRMPARYDVGASPEDDEWRMASVGDEAGRTTSYPSPPHVSDPSDDEAEHP